MNKFPKESFDTLGYYVYRLIDPCNGKTFYIGKGKENRVFDHVNDELRFSNSVDNNEFTEDEVSAKIKTIRDIHHAGLNVIHIIHRYELTEKEAMEVEAALIDDYSVGITNIQSGYNADRGIIETQTLINKLSADEFVEPNEHDYVIIKTKLNTIETNGSLYEATRRAWHLSLDKVKTYPYVLSTINGVVEEVYEVDNWYESEEMNRVEFNGHVAPDHVRNLFIHKKLPACYREKGMASPALYKKKK
jgi:hypothetical protein